jgi:hypothetical protein
VSYQRSQTVLRTMLQFFCSTGQLSFFLYGRDAYNMAELHKAPLRRYVRLMRLEDSFRQLQIPLQLE